MGPSSTKILVIGSLCQSYSVIRRLSGMLFAFPIGKLQHMFAEPEGSMHMLSGFVSVLPSNGSSSHGPYNEVGVKY